MLLVDSRILVPSSEASAVTMGGSENSEGKDSGLISRLLPHSEAKVSVKQVAIPGRSSCIGLLEAVCAIVLQIISFCFE